MRVTCKHCGGAHPAFQCRKKSTASGAQALPVDTNPDSLGKTATARRAGRPEGKEVSDGLGLAPDSPSTIQKRPRGRPRTITDMRSYKAAKQREYRERKKSEHQ